ncbi:UNVERIFIED_CONTAM: Autophagy-related protein 11 [Sesamum radiatum]|uniref:Autophagy-related protein 11 n=1 Tax=Sesamum radiatum TaxID=300843 RepID=A0AAW2NQX0_SESRA
MCSSSSEAVVQMGKLVVHIAENGRSYKLDCDECTLVESVQKFLESDCGIPFNDQLLLCLDLKLEPQQPLSAYKLPSDEREVFLFNKARMRNNSPHPAPEQVEVVDIPDPPLPSSSNSPHPLDDASDPALKALPSYERQFRFHFHCGHAIYSRALAKTEMCERLFQEQKVQERALEIAGGNLDHFYKMIHQNYTDFMKCYLQQHRSHTNLLLNFVRDKEKLRSIRILPSLQTANRKCLLDFVKEENLQKTWEDCGISHKQFENKVSEFKLEFADLKRNTEHLFSGKASFLIKDLETSIKDHQQFMNELKSIMQALSKDVNTVKKLVDDCLSGQMSSSLRPHDAVSALGPMYDSHEKDYLPKMQACESAISNLLNFCREKKNEMNMFVHNYMQKIAYIQYSIKDVRYKFSVFHEALKRQNDQFEQLKVVRGIGPAYRACLAEVVRRRAAMKLYMGKAGQLAEKLATERGAEVSRREEFFKEHGTYIPRDILSSMGLYDMPNPCDVNVIPFDCNLLDIDISDLDRYAPESLLGLSSKSEKRGSLRSSSRMSDDGSEAAEVGGSVDSAKYDFQELVEGSELVEISGTSKLEVENAKLKAELASKIALICSMSAEFDYESLDDRKLDSIVQNVAEKTSEALHLKDVYEKHLQSMLKEKQMQCESYEKRIQELELRLSDQYVQGCKLSADQDASNSVASTTKSHDNKSEVSGGGEILMHHAMDAVSCASSSKSGILPEHVKAQEGLDDNMTDSSGMLNPQLDSSMLDLNRDKGHLCAKEKKQILLSDGSTALAASNMAVSVSQKADVLSCETAVLPGLDAKVSDSLVLELQQALAEKSSQLDNAEAKIQALIDEVSELGRELEINQKLLDESQMNCAHLENCLHEAREEAQTHLCAADRRASEYSALRVSAVKMHGLFERLRSCVSSSGVAAFSDSLRALAQSLASSANENDDDSAAEFCEFVRILADKVAILSRQRAELLDRYSKAEATSEQLKKELEEKKELVNTLYLKHQVEKQIAKSPLSTSDQDHVDILTSDTGTSQLTLNPGSTSNPYGLPIGREYFVVTVAMLPDTTVRLPLPDLIANGR